MMLAYCHQPLFSTRFNMRIIWSKITLLIFLVCLNHTVFAKKKCDQSDWSCHDNYEFSMGYVFPHEYYPNRQLTEIIPGKGDFHYNPKQAFPNNFSGIRLAFGGALSHNNQFGYQMSYNQIFPKSKTDNNLQVTAEGKVFLSLLEYRINPTSRTQVALVAGAGIISSYVSINSVDPNMAFSITRNTVDVDPVIGANISYQINSRFKIKFIYFYDFATYNKSLYGRSVPALLLSYCPPL